MSCTIIETSNCVTASAALFHAPMQETANFMHQRMTDFSKNVSESFASVGEGMASRFETVRAAVQNQTVDLLRNRLNSVWQTNSIRKLDTIVEIQQAPLVMRNLIMANPVLKKKWNNDLLEGWDGEYVGDKTSVGESDYNYRRVMDGVIKDDFTHTNYHESLVNLDDALDIIKKDAVLHVWDVCNNSSLVDTVDMTSRNNGRLV